MDDLIHKAIARVFLDHHVGYNRKPILVHTLVRLTAQKMGYTNPEPMLTLKIACVIYGSDKYVFIKQDTVDTVISSK